MNVGIIGVGNMGGAMAQRLCSLGWAQWVHDVDSAKVLDLVSFGALAPVDIAQAAIESVATIVCVVHSQRPTETAQTGQHAPAHVACPHHRHRHRCAHVCTSCLDLAIDIRMPSPKPSVTMAVPP